MPETRAAPGRVPRPRAPTANAPALVNRRREGVAAAIKFLRERRWCSQRSGAEGWCPAREREERAAQPAARPSTQLLCQFPGEIRNVRLDHRRTAALEFAFERTHHARMVVSQGVNTISGEKNQRCICRPK